jgi:peptidoglycan/LPS O-acetylase OafA/YrhL
MRPIRQETVAAPWRAHLVRVSAEIAGSQTKRQDDHLKYRPDIDGLRAVAIMSVIFFHAGFDSVSGGFVGVDIFFVISGFLITTLILTEQHVGHFSIVTFYERRARRILPALFFVMFVCSIFAYYAMMPEQLTAFSKSLVFVPLFLSNFLFWNQTGYFDPATNEIPLLHTWSLGIEEQYYILLPLFIILFWRLGAKRLFWLIAALAITSMALCEYGWRYRPMANFYLIPTRAWELLIGSLLAFVSFNRPLHEGLPKTLSEALAAVGLLLVLAPIFLLTKETPSPSLYILFPTVGTALIIGFSHRKTLVSKALSLKWLVGLGAISYSAYLWHQPLFAFARILTLDSLSKSDYALLIVAALILSVLTWKFIESPFRQKTLISRRKFFALSTCAALLLIAMGTRIYVFSRYVDSRYSNRVNYGLSKDCEFGGRFQQKPSCVTSESPKILVWGDSFAMHIVPGIVASHPEVRLSQATRTVCGPFSEIAPITGRYTRQWAQDCINFNASVLSYVAQEKSIETVVMSSPFAGYVDVEQANVLTPAGIEPPSVGLAVTEMKKTVQALRHLGKKVVIFAPPPSVGYNIGDCIARKAWHKPVFGKRASCGINYSEYKEKNEEVREFLDRIGTEASVGIIRFDTTLCNESSCATMLDNVSLYRDTAHLSYSGSEVLGKTMNFYHQILENAR